MKLNNIFDDIYTLNDDYVIFARRPWALDSDAVVELVNDQNKKQVILDQGLEYFLEIFVAKEVLEVFGDRRPSFDEVRNLLIFYALNDAYPEWVYGV